MNSIYIIINEVLDKYLENDVKYEHLLNYLNTNEDNFRYVYNECYKKLTIKNISFESTELKECLRDNVRDKIALYNDLQKVKPVN